jgi:hypothetical protein
MFVYLNILIVLIFDEISILFIYHMHVYFFHWIVDWNKDWKPGPYPKTEAERIAAAKKYGLLPQDYEPYPDDGTGYGDYPKLPIISADMRDPFYEWDYPDQKRNYGETVRLFSIYF